MLMRRRQRLAARLMDVLEDITIRHHDGFFVDLFVRASNKTAIQMYTNVRLTIPPPLSFDGRLRFQPARLFSNRDITSSWTCFPSRLPQARVRARANGQHMATALVAHPNALRHFGAVNHGT